MIAVESPEAEIANGGTKHREGGVSGKKQIWTVCSEPSERGISGGKIRYPDTVCAAVVKVFGICFLLASVYFLGLWCMGLLPFFFQWIRNHRKNL